MFQVFPLAVALLAVWFSPAQAEDEWQASSLSPATIEKLNSATLTYHQCLNKQVLAFNAPGTDSRDATNWVMKQCEAELGPMHAALAEEKVPAPVIERYQRRKRNQAVRKVLQAMMYAESMKASAGNPDQAPGTRP